jgi:hypothetical protein
VDFAAPSNAAYYSMGFEAKAQPNGDLVMSIKPSIAMSLFTATRYQRYLVDQRLMIVTKLGVRLCGNRAERLIISLTDVFVRQ